MSGIQTILKATLVVAASLISTPIALAQNFTILHDFNGTDGSTPHGGLILGSDGVFYGMTQGGGLGNGTIFRMDPSGRVRSLYSFPFRADPVAPLIRDSAGNLYGATPFGGVQGLGMIFKLTTANTFWPLHPFSGGDGANPNGPLVLDSNGNLFGSTQSTVFRLDPNGHFTTLVEFGGLGMSMAGLISDSYGHLHGTLARGCIGGLAGVFEVNPANGGYGTPLCFGPSSGDFSDTVPTLVSDSTDNFFGVSSDFGANGSGMIFKVVGFPESPVLYSFSANGPDGQRPQGSLVVDAQGNLYGTTSYGGSGGKGTIFRLDANGNFTTLHSFTASEGSPWDAGLVFGNDGYLYGTTTTGGANGKGTAFRAFPCNFPAPPMYVELCLPPLSESFHANVPAIAGSTYSWTITGGNLIGGQGTNDFIFSSGSAGTRMTLQLVETDSTGCSGQASSAMQVDFADVPITSPIHNFVCAVGRRGVTSGCGGGSFCPAGSVLRSQIAIFLLRAEHGSSYSPPPATGLFADVPASSPFAPSIEQLYHEGITGGCGTSPLTYCPNAELSRAGMSVLLLLAEHGPGFAPPACTGIFADVTCPSPFADWVEQLYHEGITGGCGVNPLTFCPTSSVTRAQMAIFLTAAYNLQ